MTLASVDIAPSAPTIASGTSVQLEATAIYSDGTSTLVTGLATWTSSNEGVATVLGNDPGRGLVTGTAPGQADISAVFDGMTGTTRVTVSTASLVSISVTPANPTIPSGVSLAFTAVGVFSDGTNQDLTSQATWGSSNLAIAAVDTSGTVLAVSAGSADITARFGTIVGTSRVTVTDATLTTLSITPRNPVAAAGTSMPLQATGLFSDGTTQNLTAQLTWTSSDLAVATVGAAGLVSALTTGTSTITAALGTIVDSVTLTVTAATLSSVTITPPAPVIAAGTAQQFTATAAFSDNTVQDVTQQVTWTTSDGTVATVSNAPGSQGLASGIAEGTAAISATLSGVSGSTPLTVSAATLDAISVAPLLPSIPERTTQQFTATGSFSDGTSRDITTLVTWSSSDATVAVVSNTAGGNGLAQAVGVGSTTISASLAGVSDSTVLTVVAVTLVSIEVTPADAATAVGLTVRYAATGTYSDGSTIDLSALVTWASSDETLATISNANPGKGTATGIALGTVTITATLDTVAGTTTLTVSTAIITAIVVGPPNTEVAKGSSVPMTATATYSDGSTLDVTAEATWTSSDPAVIVVSNAIDSRGVVTALAPGNVTVSATLGGITGSTSVRATNARLVTVTVRPDSVTLARQTAQQFEAIGTFSDGQVRPLGAQVAWSSDDTAIATVEMSGPTRGRVTAVAAGSATLSATQDGVTGVAAINVTDTVLTSIAIAPDGAELPVGYQLRLRVTGTFDDGSTQDVTSLCTWTTSDGTLATVSNNVNNGSRGRVTGVAAGDVTMTATLGTISTTTIVHVTIATLTGITVTPSPVVVTVGTFTSARADGQFSSGAALDLTEQVAWTTVDTTIATVDNGRGRQGRVRGIAVGTTQVTAATSGLTASGDVNVQ